ncbi:MAG TPA: hypothetical protein VH593_29620 [Ktedonobacteraceae bacterium]|jgi:hypothetical protein
MDDPSHNDLADMPLPELTNRCREERARFLQGLANKPAYCLEIFRRALEGVPPSANAAWQALVETFTEQLQSWFYRHSTFHAALAREEASFYINGAFVRLYEMNQKQPTVLHTLPQALSYLRRCLTTVMLNGIRDIPELFPLEGHFEESGPDPIEPVLEGIAREAFWGIVLECIPDARDRRLLSLRWIFRYQPEYIHQAFPDEFPEVKEMYQMLANMLARLKRCLKAKGYRWADLENLLS